MQVGQMIAPAVGVFAQQNKDQDWPVYGGQTDNDHYSTLTQINRKNVGRLEKVWEFDTGEPGQTALETSPLVVGRVLYCYSPTQKVIALDAAMGKLLWKFDPGTTQHQASRGLAYWTDGTEGRVLAGVTHFLYALDSRTGHPIESFGEGGRIDLRKDLDTADYTKQAVSLTTPGTVYKDMIIVGFSTSEAPPAPRADIRAFDVHTGKLRWSFHTIPHPGEPGYETWPDGAWKDAGSANNWSGTTVDTQRGIVYVPTGSAVPDFYGGERLGNDLYANTLLALDANTGKLLWHFQGVHHDLWDRDFPSPPTLLTVIHDGKKTDAVAQTTKQGFVYLCDRVSGEPLFPVTEKPYPQSTVPGEKTSPTQPLPLTPEPFARQRLTEDMLTTRTPEAHAWAVQQFHTLRSGGQFFPFSVDQQTVVFPGFDGGAEWGGSAADPKTGVMYINANEMVWTGGLTANTMRRGGGKGLYLNQCAVCHGDNRAGSPPAFPDLRSVGERLSDAQIADTIHGGKGRMPPFPGIRDEQLARLIEYVKTGVDAAGDPAVHSDKLKMESKAEAGGMPQPYRFTGYRKFLDPEGYPAVAPPWGTLNAIDMNTGKYLWKIPFGEYPALAKLGMKDTGSENYGGPIVTAGGLVFIGATLYDNKMHAFDSSSGKLLWERELPYAGVGTPATYMIDGKQYVVIIACGGKDQGLSHGGVYVAFALR
jgi:quinoprotein glucose dehydrogenase